MNSCKKIIFIVLVLFCVSFTINLSYAAVNEEDVNSFKKYIENTAEEQRIENNCKYIFTKGYISKTSSYTEDNELIEEEIYFSLGAIMSNDENNVKLYNTVKNTFEKYFNKYLDESLSDDERLLGYEIVGPFIYTREENYKDGDEIEAKIGAYVFPASDTTIWGKNKEIVTTDYCLDNSQKTIYGYSTDEYYIRLTKQGEEYEISFIDTFPEGYADFIQRVKDKTSIDLENINYADFINAKSTTEVITENAEKENFESAMNENSMIIEKRIQIGIIVICVILIFIIVINSRKDFKHYSIFSKLEK